MTDNSYNEVITVFLINDEGKVLVLKRSKKVGSYQCHWAGISGYKEHELALEQAYTELQEELSINRKDLLLIKTGKPLKIKDNNNKWKVHPFLFKMNSEKNIKLDWEHTEYKWILPSEMTKLKTVPQLKETLESVYTI